jgi:hypothetical protein
MSQVDKITDLLLCKLTGVLKGSEYANVKSYRTDEDVGFLKAVLSHKKVSFHIKPIL